MLRHQAKIANGRIHPVDDARFRRELSGYEGQLVDIVVKRHREAASDPQRRYYFGVIVAILAEHFGYEKDEMHAAMKWHFLRFTDEHGIDRVPSYTKLTTAQAEDYHDRIRRWALTEHGVDVPEPNAVQMEFEMN